MKYSNIITTTLKTTHNQKKTSKRSSNDCFSGGKPPDSKINIPQLTLSLLFLLMFNSAIHAQPTLLTDYTITEVDVSSRTSTSSEFNKRINMKYPTMKNGYLSFRFGLSRTQNSASKLFEKIDLDTGKMEAVTLTSNTDFILSMRYYENGFKKFMLHSQSDKTTSSMDTIFAGRFNFYQNTFVDGVTITLNDKRGLRVTEAKFETFDYSELHNFLIYSYYPDTGNNCHYSAMDIDNSNNIRRSDGTFNCLNPVSYFLKNRDDMFTTEFVALNMNEDTNFLTIFDFTKEKDMKPILTKSRADITPIALTIDTYGEKRNYDFESPNKGSEILAICSYSSSKVVFSDFDLKDPSKAYRSFDVHNHSGSIRVFYFFRVHDSGFYLIHTYPNIDSGYLMNVINNNNGINPIEKTQLDLSKLFNIISSFSTTNLDPKIGNFFINGKNTSGTLKSYEVTLFQNPVNPIYKCVDSDDDIYDPLLDTCVAECIGEKVKQIDETKQCITSDECLARNWMSMVANNYCIDWNSCTGNELYFNQVDFTCKVNYEEKEGVLKFVFHSWGLIKGVSKEYCTNVKDRDIYDGYCYACTDEAKSYFFYAGGYNYLCLSKDECTAKTDTENTYLIEETLEGKGCTTEAICKQNPDNVLSPSEDLCLTKTACVELKNGFVENNECVTKASCEAKSDSSNTYLIKIALDGTKSCVTEADCKADDIMVIYPTENYCITKTLCTTEKNGFVIITSKTCEESCPSTSEYKNPTSKTCYSQTECQSTTDPEQLYDATYTLSGTTSKFCLTKLECGSQDKLLFNLDTSKCLYKTQCKKVEHEDTGMCMNACPSDYYWDEFDLICLTGETCGNSSGSIKFTYQDGKNECISRFTCGKFNWDFWMNPEETECFDPTRCPDIKISSKKQCAKNCDLYLNHAGDECHTETECQAFNSDTYYTVIGDSQNFCLTEAECKINDSVIWQNGSPGSCVKLSECTGFKVNGVCESTCPNYSNLDESICMDACDLPKHKFEPSNVGEQKYCLNDEECQRKEGYLLRIPNSGDNTCIEEAKCDNEGNEEVWILSSSKCTTACPDYLDNDEFKCYNEEECKAISSEAHYPVGETSDTKKWCLKEEECKNKSGYILEIKGQTKSCIKEEQCSGFHIKELNLCLETCADYYLNEAKDKCYSETECDQLTGGPYFKVTDKENQKFCITQTECEDNTNFVYDVDNTSCMKIEDCDRIIVGETKQCSDSCSDYLTSDEKFCYSETECDGLTGDHFKVTGEDSKKFCLLKEECEKKEGFLFDVDNNVCIKNSDCDTNSRFIVDEEGRCKNTCDLFIDITKKKCFTENECLNNESKLIIIEGSDRKCLSKVECGNEGYKVKTTDKEECLTEAKCREINYFIKENDCLVKCPETHKFNKEKICYEKCPNSDEFGQLVTFECVKASECKSVTLDSGKDAVGKGDPTTGKCILEIKVETSTDNQDNLIEIAADEGLVNLNYDPREKITGIDEQENKVYLLLPFDLSNLSPEERKKVIKSLDFGNRRRRRNRILQNEIEYEIVIPESDPTKSYLVFSPPTDQEFKVKINFDTEMEIPIKLPDGSFTTFKIELTELTYAVPADPSVSKVEEPNGIIAYFTTLPYDLYLRVISPFIGTQFQFLLSRDYQKKNLLNHFNGLKLSKNDWLYYEIFRDWVSEGGKVILNGDENGIKKREIKVECLEGSERSCIYEKNLTLLTGGLGGLILMGIFFIIGMFAGIISGKKDTENGFVSLILYKALPSAILGLQTNLIFYTIYSLENFYNQPASSMISLFSIPIILILVIQSQKENTALNKYMKKIFKKNLEKIFNNNLRIYLLSNMVFDLLLSITISTLYKEEFIQGIILVVLEIIHIALLILKNPFKNKILSSFILTIEGISVIQAISIALVSILKEGSKFIEFLMIVLSYLTVFISLVLIVLFFLRKENEGEIKKKNYEKTNNKEDKGIVGDKKKIINREA